MTLPPVPDFSGPIEIDLSGGNLIRHHLFNKGTAFTEAERDTFRLHGLLPPNVGSLEGQVSRRLKVLRNFATNFERYAFIRDLQDTNETVFYALLTSHMEELLPIVYTPTVGEGCQRFSEIWRKPRGLFISYPNRHRMTEILNRPNLNDVRVIVVTDGERILGLGDLGANGMGIPVGKLSLYSACAGVHPELCLPVVLDVGTNNEELLGDPFYLGLRQKRLTGAAYDELVDEFMTAARQTFPGVLIQFEDFANHSAFRLLHKYRDEAPVFNDDIQGTAAVALAGLFSALRVSGGKLRDQRLLFLGAGEAATGIADLVVSAMMAEGASEDEALRRNWLVDSRGLVVRGREGLSGHKLRYAHDHAAIADFATAIRTLKPTAIIGVAAVGGAFTPEVLRLMAELNQRPIIFALSNPTSKSECSAEDAYRYTEGRALFACGSPYDPVKLNGKTFVPRQGNNSYIFPGVGLGAIASGSRLVTDEMFMSAAHALADCVKPDDLGQGSLYPALPRIREVSAKIATAVANVAYQNGLAVGPPPNDLSGFIEGQMYDPHY